MSTVTVPQVNPNDEITAFSVNQGPNAIAAVVNGNIDDTNISTVSGAKITGGTLPASAMTADANPETRMAESLADFIASGCVWSILTGLNGAMTSGIAYVTGKRLTVAAVASNTFTASRDTYVYISNVGSVQYNPVANNAAQPATPANTVLVAKIVTSASAITSVVAMPGRPVSKARVDLNTFGVVDANGWSDYGFFYLKEFNHTDATSIAANTSVYINTTSSAGSGPVAEGGVFPSSKTIVMSSAASGSTAAQAGVIASNDIAFPRGFFVFNGGTSAATWGTRKVTMMILR